MFVDEDYIEEMLQKREGQEPSGLNKYSKRPRLKINKLSDDKRSVALALDIEINDKLVVRERFDWPLDYINISPGAFAERLCNELGIPDSNIENIKRQIITQIIDHIERNTNPNQKTKQKIETLETDMEIQPFDYLGLDKKEEEEQGGIKQTGRQKILEEMRKKTSNAKFTADGKKECRYCQTVQIPVSEFCKHCKLPFKFSDNTNMEVEREALTMKFLDELVKNIDVVADAELEKTLSVDDFQSVYYLKNVLTYKFLELPEVKEDNIGKELVNAINTVYKEVVSGVEGFEKEESESKSEEGDEKDTASMAEEGESPEKPELVQKVIRKRGRPPKKNPAPKKFMLRKNR